MSAYLVDRACITAIVMVADRAKRHGLHGTWDALSNDELGRMLWKENMRSLGARYGDPEDEATLAGYHYGLTNTLLAASPVALIKNLHCYRYQSCEHREWEGSQAAALVDALESYLVHRLPGYDAAPWGFSDEKGAGEVRPIF
ncbi:MAG: hypothetical protein ACYDDA_15735 [Acidiferrobacteraceae bacterium]